MGSLLVDRIDLNDANLVNSVVSTIRRLIKQETTCYPLKFRPPQYFGVPQGTMPSEAGWYVILDGKIPIYVGEADDLNKRLNTRAGSTDNFANSKRKSDDKRNLVKKLNELGVFPELRVCVIREQDLCFQLGLSATPLTPLDRGNIEKLIDIHRCHLAYEF